MQTPFCAIMRSWMLLAAFGSSYAPDDIHDEKWKYEPTFFVAKNKDEDSDLGWTADLKINFEKL